MFLKICIAHFFKRLNKICNLTKTVVKKALIHGVQSTCKFDEWKLFNYLNGFYRKAERFLRSFHIRRTHIIQIIHYNVFKRVENIRFLCFFMLFCFIRSSNSYTPPTSDRPNCAARETRRVKLLVRVKFTVSVFLVQVRIYIYIFINQKKKWFLLRWYRVGFVSCTIIRRICYRRVFERKDII